MGEEVVHALRGVTLKIHRNEYIAIMGPSGSGKSTLMNMLGCLDTPTSGRYEFNGKSVAEMDDDELAAVRNREIGFVFQTFNLLPRSTSLRNVELPLIYAGIEPERRMERATQVLTDVGLGDRPSSIDMKRLLYELSESWKIAAAQMRSNLTRSTLTALGVIIGIIAVTLMGTAVNGISIGFDKSMAVLGDDVLYVTQWPWKPVEDWWN